MKVFRSVCNMKFCIVFLLLLSHPCIVLAEELVSHFDWALNEQCFQYNECDKLLPFIQAGKAVFGVEYEGNTAVFCPEANTKNYDWLKKNLDLDAWQESCR